MRGDRRRPVPLIRGRRLPPPREAGAHMRADGAGHSQPARPDGAAAGTGVTVGAGAGHHEAATRGAWPGPGAPGRAPVLPA
ncbi:MAG: hypothetical protein ACK559_29270, partial [bacterium]